MTVDSYTVARLFVIALLVSLVLGSTAPLIIAGGVVFALVMLNPKGEQYD